MFIILLCIHFLVVLVLSLITRKEHNSNTERILFAFVVLAFCLLVAIRPDQNLPDVDAYRSRYYHAFQETSLNTELSIGLFRKSAVYYMNVLPSVSAFIFSSAGISFELYSFIIAFIECLIILKSVTGMLRVWGYEYNLFRLFLMYMAFYGYYYQMIAFAQGMSMAFVFPALYFWIRKKRILSLAAVLLAVLCHSTGMAAVLIIAIYTISKQYSRKTYNCLWFIATALLVTGLGFSFSWATEGIIKGVVGVASSFYSEYENYDSVTSVGRASFISIIIFILSKFILSADTKKNEYWKIANIYFISMAMGVIFVSWEVISRLADVFFVMIIPLACICVYERSFSFYSLDGNKYFFQNGEILTVDILCAAKTLSFLYILIHYTNLYGS